MPALLLPASPPSASPPSVIAGIEGPSAIDLACGGSHCADLLVNLRVIQRLTLPMKLVSPLESALDVVDLNAAASDHDFKLGRHSYTSSHSRAVLS